MTKNIRGTKKEKEMRNNRKKSEREGRRGREKERERKREWEARKKEKGLRVIGSKRWAKKREIISGSVLSKTKLR